MPSLVFPISALPRSFGGLLFGVLKIFNVDNQPVLVVPEYSAPPPPTKTTPMYLPPTRCIPSPSSSSSESPLLGLLAMVIIASVVCIVCTMFDASPPETRPPPPPPPRKPAKSRPTSFSSNRDPWSRVIWVYLATIALGTPIAHHLYFDKPRLVGDLGTRIMLMVENAFLTAWDSVESLFSVHIVPHWQQYLKLWSFALASHSMGFLVLLTYRRWYRLFADVLQTPWVPFFFAPFIVPVVVFASTRKFSWILWFTYSTVDHQLPTPQAMHDRLLQLPAELYLLVGATDSLDAWMMLGPYILNIITLVLLTISLILRSVPWALRRMHHERDFTCRVLLCSAALITFSASLLGGCLSYHYFSAEYRIWPAEAQRVFWRSFHCSDARSQLLHILRFIWERNLRWKQQRILEFGNHGQELWRELWEAIGFCVGTWRALHLIHKLVMVVPIVMLYGHYYVMPEIRRQWHGWRFRRRRRCPDSYIPTLGRESVSSNSWTASRSAQRNDKAQDTAREEHSRRDAAAMKIVGDAQLFFAISKPFYLQDILKRCFCSLALRAALGSSNSVR